MPKLRKPLLGTVAIINGASYFTIATGGGLNLQKLIGDDSETIYWLIIGISIEASIVYTLFVYKNFQGVTVRINSIPKGLFALLAPITAASFLTGSLEGSEQLEIPPALSILIGCILYCLRIIACVDAEIKFPRRFLEVAHTAYHAIIERDVPKLIRLTLMILIMAGYLASITDGIYRSAYMGANLIGIAPYNQHRFSFAASILGAIGAIPTSFYWVHQGLAELTFGTSKTDRYTFIGMVLILPSILGIFGALTASTGNVFGRLGFPSIIIRLITSILYGILTGTPGMSNLLRGIRGCCHDDAAELSPPTITITTPTPPSTPRNRNEFFAIEIPNTHMRTQDQNLPYGDREELALS